MQFRVGLFTIVALGLMGVMVFKFGQLDRYWKAYYTVQVDFENAGGIYPGTPVKRHGIQIGQVNDLKLVPGEGYVKTTIRIAEEYPLSNDVEPRVVRSLLGGVTIEMTGGTGGELLVDNSLLTGRAAADPMQIVNNMEKNVTKTLNAFAATSEEWRVVGTNVNSLLENNHDKIDHVIEQSSESLEQFALTMKQMNRAMESLNVTIADPQNQENLRRTLASMPKLVSETEQTIKHIRLAVDQAEGTLGNMQTLTEPLAQRSNQIALNLDGAIQNLNSLTGELNRFSHMVNKSDGTLHQLVSNPDLYRHLDKSSQSINILLENLGPTLRDLRIFSDKVATHPELLGVSGVFKGSAGVKEAPETGQGSSPIRQTSGAMDYGRSRK
ncbi:mce related protein [Polystyrenella longa]|uniref:Mce related protein n=2 Tax=Polystyrenella longa TaxID=2528007 RepID=A0A518CKU9_9PLAN|nr:mce related protein [Polystyrenella longa]